jgi:hypothetical protein
MARHTVELAFSLGLLVTTAGCDKHVPLLGQDAPGPSSQQDGRCPTAPVANGSPCPLSYDGLECFLPGCDPTRPDEIDCTGGHWAVFRYPGDLCAAPADARLPGDARLPTDAAPIPDAPSTSGSACVAQCDDSSNCGSGLYCPKTCASCPCSGFCEAQTFVCTIGQDQTCNADPSNPNMDGFCLQSSGQYGSVCFCLSGQNAQGKCL